VRFDRKDLGGAALVLASALSIQLGAALATTTFDTISPVSATGVSYAFAALVLLVVQPPLRVASWDRQKWLDALALGLTAACASSFFYLSLDRLPLGSAVTIEFVGPLGLAIVSGRSRGVFLAAGLALAGVALVSGASPEGDAAGVGFALVAGLGWGLYMVASRRAGRHGYPGEGLTIALCVTTIACLPFSAAAVPHLGAASILGALALVGIFGRAMPFRLELAALSLLRPSKAGVLFSVEPAIAAIVGAVALGQSLAVPQVLGILAVVAAGVLVLREVPAAD
jgi:inner membrane transporter RhtA